MGGGPGYSSGPWAPAYRFPRERTEREPVVKTPPPPGWSTCMCVFYKAVASRFRGKREFASTGRGRARRSWVFPVTTCSSHICMP